MDYRQRIYQSYVTSRHESFAPTSVDGFKTRAPYFRRIIQRYFPSTKDARILEVGCGHGAFIYCLHALGYRNATGIDRSPEQVSEAQRLGIVGVEHGDLMPKLASLPEGSIDVLVAFDVIEHLRKDEAISLAQEAYRVLHHDGRLILHTVNADSPFFGTNRYGDLTHEIAFNRASMGQLLMSSGFAVVDCYEDAPVAHGPKSFMRMILWKGIRSILRFYTAVETGDTGQNAILTRNFLTMARK
jgi:SAM-dependent methyltransferase